MAGFQTSAGAVVITTPRLFLLDRVVFLVSGTWTKPADGAGNVRSGVGQEVRYRLIGGGQSGKHQASNVPGGYGGQIRVNAMNIEDMPESVVVGVGAGGTGVYFGGGGSTVLTGIDTAHGGSRSRRSINRARDGSGSGDDPDIRSTTTRQVSTLDDPWGDIRGVGGSSKSSTEQDGNLPGGDGVAVIEVWGLPE
ncbi:hypothetical protein [Iodidimonas muriae]|uniref:hypothetical protein n=1 Tax=Iodidimonas muriae TaxID=261467 RepID=UPI001230D6D8|nr:hypothetical protein [Iodidimonas muriae]